MQRRLAGFFLLLLLWSSACVVAVVNPRSGGRPWPRNAFRKVLDLNRDASVSVENEEGTIEIAGWNEDRIDISAEKGGEYPRSAGIYFMGRRFSAPDIQVRSTENSVRIRSKGSGVKDGDGPVHYFLKVPRSVSLDSVRNGQGKISVSDLYGRALLDEDEGEIFVANYSGSLDIRLGNGSVEAEVLDLRPQDSVRIRVDRGNIVLFLEPQTDAQLMAEAPEGNVVSELDLGQSLPAKKVSARLGGGQASIELTAAAGDIKIRKVEAPS
jgi:hypothetical protein